VVIDRLLISLRVHGLRVLGSPKAAAIACGGPAGAETAKDGAATGGGLICPLAISSRRARGSSQWRLAMVARNGAQRA
jgi:tetrahydromethanopterin S-methyltransferase subunit D